MALWQSMARSASTSGRSDCTDDGSRVAISTSTRESLKTTTAALLRTSLAVLRDEVADERLPRTPRCSRRFIRPVRELPLMPGMNHTWPDQLLTLIRLSSVASRVKLLTCSTRET